MLRLIATYKPGSILYFSAHVALRARRLEGKLSRLQPGLLRCCGFPTSRENCSSHSPGRFEAHSQDVFSLIYPSITSSFMPSPSNRSRPPAESGEVDLGVDPRRSGC